MVTLSQFGRSVYNYMIKVNIYILIMSIYYINTFVGI